MVPRAATWAAIERGSGCGPPGCRFSPATIPFFVGTLDALPNDPRDFTLDGPWRASYPIEPGPVRIEGLPAGQWRVTATQLPGITTARFEADLSVAWP